MVTRKHIFGTLSLVRTWIIGRLMVMAVRASVGLLVLAVLTATVAAEPVRVTLNLQERPVAEVIAALSAQAPGVQIATTAADDALVTVQVADASLDAAIGALAWSLQGSFVRGYLIERVGPGDEPYSAQDLIEFMDVARQEWRARLTPERREAFGERTTAAMRARLDEAQVAPTDEQSAMIRFAERQLTSEDPLIRLALTPVTESISVDLVDATIEEAVDEVMFQSGYIVLVEEGVEGELTLRAQDQPVGEVLDSLAAAVDATCRSFYVVSQPVQLTPEQVDQRLQAGFQFGWQAFWGSAPAERARLINEALTRMESLPPETLQQIAAMPMARRVFDWLIMANTQLTPEQRREFMPLMQAVVRMMGR